MIQFYCIATSLARCNANNFAKGLIFQMLKELKENYNQYIIEIKTGIIGVVVFLLIFAFLFFYNRYYQWHFNINNIPEDMWICIVGIITMSIMTIVDGIKAFNHNKKIKNTESEIHNQLDWIFFKEVKISNTEDVFEEYTVKKAKKFYAIKNSTTDLVNLIAVSDEGKYIDGMTGISQSKEVIIESVIENSIWKSPV